MDKDGDAEADISVFLLGYRTLPDLLVLDKADEHEPAQVFLRDSSLIEAIFIHDSRSFDVAVVRGAIILLMPAMETTRVLRGDNNTVHNDGSEPIVEFQGNNNSVVVLPFFKWLGLCRRLYDPGTGNVQTGR